MEDRKPTERESLEIITTMITRTKERYIGDGNIMLLWGYTIVAVTILVWGIIACTHNPVWNWLWFLIWIIGGTATPIMAKKQKAERRVKNYSDRITSRIWSIVGCSGILSTIMCVAFVMIGDIDTWGMMFTFALVIVPFAEIVQGVILNEKSLIIGGSIGFTIGIYTICCIAGRISLNAYWFLPLFMVAYVCMLVIPGHVLNYKAKIR